MDTELSSVYFPRLDCLDIIVIPSIFCQLVYSFIHLLSCLFVCLGITHLTEAFQVRKFSNWWASWRRHCITHKV